MKKFNYTTVEWSGYPYDSSLGVFLRKQHEDNGREVVSITNISTGCGEVVSLLIVFKTTVYNLI
jgi:hypothetical protein